MTMACGGGLLRGDGVPGFCWYAAMGDDRRRCNPPPWSMGVRTNLICGVPGLKSAVYPTGLVTTLLCCGDVILGAGGGKHTCDGEGAGPGLLSPCECGVPMRGDGCIGDIPLGLCRMLVTEPGPGEWDIMGLGLCKGELCWVRGDADGDIMGD